ncbi:hypothetical protein XM38_036610 [Halomicronema hongdechloris C2206]|uniref:Uncharacterized protein n=1 Tax=Halomicronema hongdechloris C2206 TaxID=1641165 RepID=A0A1Z3HQW9_9CYAN|nr:hypothetical protein XM38_036610 [Halomicronema hongdechloris C2206]
MKYSNGFISITKSWEEPDLADLKFWASSQTIGT